MHIKYTQVDAQTRIPVTECPAFNGPDSPAVEGLEFGFALESQYPTPYPVFFGTCPDGTNIDIPGVQGEVSEEDYNAALAQELADRFALHKRQLQGAVTGMRDQRESAGFAYMGKVIDSDPRSVLRINTLAMTAQAALASEQPFAIDWTCQDNSALALDAMAAIGMPAALAMWANTLHQHARGLKDLIDAAQTPDELQEIELQDGWPE